MSTASARSLRVGVKPGPWGWRYQELVAAWQRAEALGFDIVACFDHVTSAPRGFSAWDAPTLLAAMAGRTHRVALSVDVINIALRHPFLLAAELAVAQAASGGRLEVGLGAGSYALARHDHPARGIPFPNLAQPRARLSTAVRALRALWRGEVVDEPSLGLRNASLGPIDIGAPPILLGGTSDAVIDLAVREADGWNVNATSVEEFSVRNRLVDLRCERQGRRTALLRHVQVFADGLEPTAARDMVLGFAAAGANAVIFVFHQNREPAAMDRLARAVIA